jgi:hypothetical protein
VASTAISKSTKAEMFFRLQSVQHELKTMEPSLRQERINAARSQLGFTDEQIQQLEQFDQDRNKRWDNGARYLEEREQLGKQYSGEEFAAKLQLLQQKYFAEESYTIALEEKNGFFRYKRPRVYGRN